MSALDARPTPPADLLVRGAHVLDPRTGIDAPHDVLIRGGEIAELGAPGSLDPGGAEVIDSPQAVIGQQVEAGVVVRMAVLYELLAGRSAPQPAISTPIPA